MRSDDTDNHKKDIFFVVITVIYLAVCAGIYIFTDLSAKASYVKPVPIVSSENEEAIPENEKININTAGIDELMKVKGIGEITASLIVDYRTEHGEFYSIDELLRIRGIGSKTLEKIRAYIKLND